MNTHIFREYDIRGLVDKDLTLEVVELLGLGLGTIGAAQGRPLHRGGPRLPRVLHALPRRARARASPPRA